MAKKKRKSVGDQDEANSDSPIDFEQALADVESIVGKLESGELGLTESLQQYEIAIKRLKQCHSLLEKAQRRVTLLSGIDEDGHTTEETFDVDEVDSPGNKSLRKRRPPGEGGAAQRESVDDLPGLF